MTGDKSKFAKLELKDEGFVTYGDNNKGKILENGVISNGFSFHIKNVLLVLFIHMVLTREPLSIIKIQE